MVKKWTIALILFVLSAVVLSIAFYFVYPDVSMLRKVNPKKSAFMEYRENEWLRQGKKKKIVQQWVPLSQISPYVIKAVIIAEDDKFWSHEGFDFDAMQKALEKDLKQKKFKAGGSTISQQLAKNLFLSPSKNPIRKLMEAVLTWRLERNLSKKRIIEIYLNVAEWGDGLFGIEAASHRYYHKPASDLSALEAAKLAAVLPNPRRYNPVGGSHYVAYRSELIYQIMVRRGIVIEGYDDVMNEPPGQGDGSAQDAGQTLESGDPVKAPASFRAPKPLVSSGNRSSRPADRKPMSMDGP
ncbi:MAG: monofunctional biosynthetic peptidoglycan transglycosylase [Pseudomonadota bacterium]